jgi:beta-N-acetylhexosaminidase
MGEAAVRALTAGADALVLGHDIGPREVAAVHLAVLQAVSAGALPEPRVAEAAARVGELSRWVSEAPPSAPASRSAGPEAARRALAVEGDVAIDGAPLVVELRPQANIAAGPTRHGLGELLTELVPGVQTVVVTDGSAAADGLVPDVVVVRDAARHTWQRSAAESLLRRAPNAVVVEVGLPGWRPPAARRYVATHGAARVNLAAAAERLAG